MPIYEFKCSKCKKIFETLIRRQEEEGKLSCQFCASKNLIKLFSTFGIGGGKSENLQASSSCGRCVSKNCANCK